MSRILPRRMRGVGARSVFHMLQLNGKQGGVNAMQGGQTGLQSAATSNLRCPRNGKRTNAAFLVKGCIPFSSRATEGFYDLLGRR